MAARGKSALPLKSPADIRGEMVQNIDFSRKTGSSAREVRQASGDHAGISRLLGWGLAGAILIFTGGIVAGLKIADLRSLERNVVKYPDGQKGRSFANVGDGETERTARAERHARTDRSDRSGDSSDPAEEARDGSSPANREERSNRKPADRANDRPASLIIRIGAFRPARAGELARSLNAIPELSHIAYHSCRGISDLNPSRSHVFPVPADDRKTHRLFAGCYSTQEEARQALDIIAHTGVASLKDAKVYELSE